MTLQSRRRIFYALVALFFIVGAAVILYALGWRINLTTFKPEKVGAIFVRSFPSGAAITLDGKPEQNQSGLLSNGTLISNLYPGTFHLTLSAPGYDNWQEDAPVLPTLVTKFDDAVLVPVASSAAPAASGTTVTSFAVVGGQTIYENASGTVTWRGAAIGKGTIVSTSANLQNIILENGATSTDILYDFTSGDSMNLGTLLAKNNIAAKNITSIAINPYDATQIIVGSAQRIWMIDLSNGTVTEIARVANAPESGSGSAFTGAQRFGPSIAASQGYLAWAESSATSTAIAVYDTFANITATSSVKIAGANVEMKWLTGSEIGVLQNDGELYIYHADTQTFQKLADDVEDFAISPDNSMIAALESTGIEILPQSGDAAYARLPINNAAQATQIAWYKDSDHLFVEYPNSVSFLSIDDTALVNYTTVAQTQTAAAGASSSAPYYDPQANALYLITTDGQLVRFNFPS